MRIYDVKARYTFEGTYTVAAEDRNEARKMVMEDCGLVLGGNIHTIRDDDEVLDWNFGVHPMAQVFSIRQGGGRYPMMAFDDRIEGLRQCIIGAIRQLLDAHGMTGIRFPEDDGHDPVWIIWFNKNGDPEECRVTGLRMTDTGMTVTAEEKFGAYEVECCGRFDLGARNIDWLHEMYEAVWRQLEETGNVEPKTEEA